MDKNDIVYVVGSCIICGYPLRVTWTDYHGEAVCLTCGTPYQLLQYDINGELISRSLPLLALRSEWIAPAQEYWHVYHRNLGLGTYMIRHPRVDDAGAFYEWLLESEWSHILEGE